MMGLPINALGRFDLAAGTVETLYAGPNLAFGEVVFAPRSADAPEGDGWVLSLANDIGGNAMGDIYASADYRTAMAGVYLKRAVNAALG